MGLVLLLVMIGVPIAEIATLIKVGGYLGLVPTIGIVILTAFIGAALLRWQGLAIFYSAQECLRQNRFPVDEVFDGLCLILAGTLLLAPGFITDTAGLLLFAPPLRVLLRWLMARQFVAYGHIQMETPSARVNPNSDDATVIDGECDDLTAAREENGERPEDNPKRLEH